MIHVGKMYCYVTK